MFAYPKLLYTGRILQENIKEGRKWHQPVTECYKQELQEWRDEFDSMTSIQNPRRLIPNTNGTHQLHRFTDASVSAISAIVYVRTTDADGSSTSQYVISKKKQKWHRSSS